MNSKTTCTGVEMVWPETMWEPCSVVYYWSPAPWSIIIHGSALAAAEGKNHELGRDRVLELMAAVDENIPEPTRDLDKPFLMPIEDVFSIAGRGTVVTGRIEQGKVNVGDELEVVAST